MKKVLISTVFVLFLMISCKSDNLNAENDIDNTPLMGTEGGPCYWNGLCNIGLECDQKTNLCVEAKPVCEDGERMCSSFDNARHILICVGGFWESERDCYNQYKPTEYYCREGWDGELYCNDNEIGLAWTEGYGSERVELGEDLYQVAVDCDSFDNIVVPKSFDSDLNSRKMFRAQQKLSQGNKKSDFSG